mgnify:CR=1 FL=1
MQCHAASYKPIKVHSVYLHMHVVICVTKILPISILGWMKWIIEDLYNMRTFKELYDSLFIKMWEKGTNELISIVYVNKAVK